jgi:exonuclease III
VSKYPWSFWNTCLSTGAPGKQGFGGVGVLCRKRPTAVQYGFGSLEEEKEGRVTVIRWKDATLVAVYAPASLTDGTAEHMSGLTNSVRDLPHNLDKREMK